MNCRKNRGFSLLEVLITMLLTTIGILGMLAMQGKAIQYTQDSAERTHAVILANDLMEIIRATPRGVQPDANETPFFDSLPAGRTDGCLEIAEDAIQTQIDCWAGKARAILPGAGEVADIFHSCVSATPGLCDDGAAVEIRLAWVCQEADADTPCTYTFRSQI